MMTQCLNPLVGSAVKVLNSLKNIHFFYLCLEKWIKTIFKYDFFCLPGVCLDFDPHGSSKMEGHRKLVLVITFLDSQKGRAG